MSKHINRNDCARKKLLQGIDTVADIVKATLGPCGSNVILKTPYNVPVVINDGVSIAKEITLSDPTENAGATLLTSAASATNSAVGDGTTTTCILTQALIEGGFRAIKEGSNPILLREQLKKCLNEFVLPCLEKQVENCDTIEDLKNVATISVGGNSEYGNLIGDAVDMVGADGVINIENNLQPETILTKVDGYKIDRGYMSPYAITDTDKYIVDYSNCLVLCCYHKITERSDVESLFQYAYQSGKSILLILEDIDESIFGGLQVNLMRKTFRICPVKSPGFGFNVRDYMNDIAKLTGCIVYADDTKRMKDFSPEDFGSALKATVTREYTCILRDPELANSELSEYVTSLKNQLEHTENQHMKDSLKERIAKLTVGVATISVGATSQTEQNELKLRIEDAVNATKAAAKSGIVSGGGCAFRVIAREIKKLLASTEFSSKEGCAAYEIMMQALEKPEKQILLNSGCDDTFPELDEEQGLDPNYGFDGVKKFYTNLKSAGIIDPALVIKSAIENSVAVASIILTTNATIISEDKSE